LTESQITIINQLGLHMRAAGKFAKLAGKFRSQVHLLRDGVSVDAKSIVGLLTLAAAQGSVLTLRIEGADEKEAHAALTDLVATRFGEER